MATAFKAPPITVEQYKAFQGYPGLKDELINGEIVLSPQPKPLHQEVLANILFLLREALNSQDFTAQTNTNIDFGTQFSMPAPDVFIIGKTEWRRARDSEDYLQSPPLLVVEVLSPANKKPRVEQKITIYLNGGVTEIWLIEPKKQTLERVTNQKRAKVKSEAALPAPLTGKIALSEIFKKV